MTWKMSVEEIVEATGGQLLSSPVDSVGGIGTDTRKPMSGQLFIALKGDNFDAHDYLAQAVDQGATAVLIHRESKDLKALKQKVSVIQVSDTLQGLQDLANYWRRINEFHVVAITGSNGKTTTKEFTQAILKDHKKTSYSRGSFNNHWGVPLTLLAAQPDSEVVIVEMGMNHQGEITRLCEIAEPNVVVVTVVGTSHIGELGSQEAVANAKEEIYRGSPQAVHVFNLDNEFTITMYEKLRGQVPESHQICFSSFRKADVSLRVNRMDMTSIEVSGRIREIEDTITVPVTGRQNVTNLMAAASLALACGLSPEQIWQSLPECQPTWGRNQLVETKSGARVVFDGYNANPESMAALLKNLFEWEVKGKKIAVLGEMLELGSEAPAKHQELGELVAGIGLDAVWFIGPHQDDFAAGLERGGFQKTLLLSDTYEQTLALKIGSVLNKQDVVVIKGSRGMKLEQVLKAWEPVNFENKI